jgi:MFS family permease
MTTRSGPSLAPTGAAVSLVGALVAIYMVSQFLRNSVGVIAPDLAAELGLTAVDIGLLSSAFFFAFAAVQLPLGMAMDRFGPKACLLVCAAVTIVGTVLFAAASSTTGLIVARVLLGIGSCSSLMAPLAIYARRFPPGHFAMLTGLQVGLGSVGTLCATAPLAFAAAMIGWRGSFLAVGAITLVMALLVALVVTDAPTQTSGAAPKETVRDSVAGILAVLRTPSVGRLFLVQLTGYSSFALVVGLWGGPYLTHVYGYGLQARGDVLFFAAVAQILGSLAWGPMDRLFGNHKVPVLSGVGSTAAALAWLALVGTPTPAMLVVWFCALGFLCAYTPVMIAHGKSLFPPHLVGRGITVLNMGTMGGVFLAQAVSGAVIDLFPAEQGAYPLDAYRAVFALQGAFVLASGLIYLGARDPLRTQVSRAQRSTP